MVVIVMIAQTFNLKIWFNSYQIKTPNNKDIINVNIPILCEFYLNHCIDLPDWNISLKCLQSIVKKKYFKNLLLLIQFYVSTREHIFPVTIFPSATCIQFV